MDTLLASLRECLAATLAPLPDKPEETVDSTLRALCFAAAGQPCSAVAAMRSEPPPLRDETRRQALRRLVERRLAGEPLAYLTGRCHFMGLELLADPAALIPRAATEILVQAGLERLQAVAGHRPRAIDACTGSGVFALLLASRLPQAEVHGADLSAEALALATRNREHLGLARVQLHHGDLLAPFGDEFDGSVDLVICSPPYILSDQVPRMAPEIAAHEPRLAFDGGPLGVAVLLRLLEESPRVLRRGGWLAFEAGQKLGPAMARRLARNPHFEDVRSLLDADGDVRAVLARRT